MFVCVVELKVWSEGRGLAAHTFTEWLRNTEQDSAVRYLSCLCVERQGQAAMALFVDSAHCMGAYYCLIRTRFKRRRKKRSERKGQNAFFNRPDRDLRTGFPLLKLDRTQCFSSVRVICISRQTYSS